MLLTPRPRKGSLLFDGVQILEDTMIWINVNISDCDSRTFADELMRAETLLKI